MNHAAIIQTCRALIKHVDRPSAGLDVWDAGAKSFADELRVLLGKDTIGPQVVQCMREMVIASSPLITAVLNLEHSQDGKLVEQDGTKLDEALLNYAQAMAALVSRIPEPLMGCTLCSKARAPGQLYCLEHATQQAVAAPSAP